ncbi:hypothetical protein [Phocaeicola sp.]
MKLLWILWTGFTWLTGTRCELPGWIYSSLPKQIVITVSDPGLDYQQARQQALQRGVYLYALKEGGELQLLHDYFTFTDTGTNKYEEVSDKVLLLSEITCKEKKYHYRIIDEYVSPFGEVFFKMSFNPVDTCSPAGVSVSGRMEVMVSNNERSDDLTCKVHVRTIEGADTVTSEYAVKRTMSRVLRRSVMNGEQLKLPGKECWYKDSEATEAKKENQPFSPLKHSFWNACLLSLFESLVIHPFKKVGIESLSENYDNSVRELHREKVEETISINMKKLSIEKDNLYVEWAIE